ncbi:hypothetical protein MXD81_31355 [Microbacteriaceae bacterium K1510]|nr:hypothetical protein [Microbacteriaceae bacterium K1510]
MADFMVIPASDPNGKRVVCYNPFLETPLPEGIASNCMSCHARATRQNAPYPATYTPNGWIDLSNPSVFSGRVKTDFVWAIPNSAQ